MKISEFRQRYIEAMKMSERSKIAELFRLADDLESVEKTEENYRILSDVFSYLGYYTKAYHYLSEVANPQDMKDAKKLYHLKDRLECEGDRYASKRPRRRKTVLSKCRTLNIVLNRWKLECLKRLIHRKYVIAVEKEHL